MDTRPHAPMAQMGTNPTRSHLSRAGGLFNGRDNAPASRARFGPTGPWENSSPWNSHAGSRRQHLSSVWGNAASVSQPSFAEPHSAEDSSFLRASADGNDGVAGFGAFGGGVADGRAWNTAANGLTVGGSATTAHALAAASGASRRPSVPHSQSSQPLQDASPYFTPSRLAPAEQGLRSNSLKPRLDPTSDPFDFNNDFNNFNFTQNGNGLFRADSALNGNYEDGSIHSPRADYQNGHGDYFENPTSASSRNGSLPPSRGEDMQQYTTSYEQPSRYNAFNNSRQPSSFSQPHARPFSERSGSMQSDSLALRPSQDVGSESGMFPHRHSIASNGNMPSYPGAADENPFYGHNNTEFTPLPRDDGSYAGAETYNLNRFSQGLNNLDVQMFNFQLDTHSAPNGTAVRQTPSISNTPTPPVHDRLYYPNQGHNTLTNSQNVAHVQNSLTRYQQAQQGRRGSNHPMQHSFSPMQQPAQTQVLTVNNMTAQYPYPHHVQNVLPICPFTPQNQNPSLVFYQIASDSRGLSSPAEYNFQGQKLNTFRARLKEGKKYELKDIYGDIVEFCGDQHGSRFIQGKLESANSEEKNRVFEEIRKDALTLMRDLFGNYVVQKFFEHGTQSQKSYLAILMKGHVQALSNETYACRVVQKALEYCLMDERAEIAQELNGDVYGTVNNQNGNHVIQKVIIHLPQKHWQFLINALSGEFGKLATNSYGCRVIQRLLEYCDASSKCTIMEELHSLGDRLISNEFGNYVAQHILEHGSPEDRTSIITIVRDNLVTFSTQKAASNVVEKCFAFGSDEQRRQMMQVVLSKNATGQQTIVTLLKDSFGNYVIQKILNILPRSEYDDFVAVLSPVVDELRKTANGKQLISVSEKMRGTRFETPKTPDAHPSFATQPRNSMSSAVDSLTEVPPLVADPNSPQSSTVPSANASVIEDQMHTTPTANKTLAADGVVKIGTEPN